MTDSNNLYILQTQLEEYAAKGLYPFHMPGHKRLMQPAPGLPVSWDVTELPGTDDLHDAHGILRDAMNRTAALWGAERTWYLVNGSTCGLLAGIRALAPRGSEVICARNCHKAVYHALELSGCRVHWILPPVLEGWGICAGIEAGQLERALRRHPAARAVILTSPTYEGILSEIGEICRICHERRIPVLVDEAHGAHLLPLSERAGFPAGALACGADLVVQSPHKTLPSLTQTALLHLQGQLVDPGRIEAELDIFETSSPSYPLIASLDGCTGILRERGENLFENWSMRLGRFASRIRPLSRLRVFYHGQENCQKPEKGIRSETGYMTETSLSMETDCRSDRVLYDPGKILIDAGSVGMTGKEFAALLRGEWQMETEMTQGTLVLAMTSPCDSEDALDRLAEALLEIDHRQRTGQADERKADHLTQFLMLQPNSVCTLADAAGQASELVPFHQAAGRICAEYLYFYPPGIPLLAPGEIITRDHLECLQKARRENDGFYRHAAGEGLRCLRE